MPIRIQRVFADPSVPTVRGPRATGDEFGGQLAATTYQAGQALQRDALSAIDVQQKIFKEYQKEDEQLDLTTKLEQLKIDYAKRETELRESGTVLPKDYPAVMSAEARRLAEETESTLKYPGSATRFRAAAAKFVGEESRQAINTGTKLLHAEIEIADDLQARDEARAVVLGTPEQREAAIERRLGRLTRYTQRGIYGADKFRTKHDAFWKDVEDGGIERDFRSPSAEVRNRVIGNLEAGRYLHSPPGEQQRKADELRNRERTEAERAATADERIRKEVAGAVDKEVTDMIQARDFAAARAAVVQAKRVMDPTQYRTWLERIDKGEVKDTDPAVKNELIPLVYNAVNNPVEVDARLRAYYAKGRIGDDDMKAWGGHLETRINRLEQRGIAAQARRTAEEARAEGRLAREQGDVEQRIRELTRVTGPAAASLDKVAQDSLNWALEDMHRNTPLYGGQERPMDWLKRNQATIMGRIGMVAAQRLVTIDKDLGDKYRPVGPTDADLQNAVKRLDTDRKLLGEPAYIDKLRLIKEKQALMAEQARFSGRAPTAPTPGAAPSAAPRSEPALKLGSGGR